MERKKKILTIGDVHGRDKWMFHTHGSPYEFNFWKQAVENGAPGDDNFWKDCPYMGFDKIIFVGDYVDSYDLKNETILNNLKNIVFFKKMVPDKVVLLLGNHDIQYFIKDQICSGYRGEMYYDLNQIFNDKDLDFKIAHLEKDVEENNYLWTHAGVTRGWLKETKIDILYPGYRFYDMVKELEKQDIDVFLNALFEIRCDNLFHVDEYSGGIHPWAGPLWVRPKVFNNDRLERINQIVGHTPQNAIKIENIKEVKHYFVDCLWDDNDEALILEL